MGHDPIDFGALASALLDRARTLVPMWLPGGEIRGHEYVCADLSGGKGRSFSVKLEGERAGSWADFSGDDKGGDLISLYAAVRGLNNGQAAHELMRDLGMAKSTSSAPSQASAPRAAASDRPEPPWADEPPAGEGGGGGSGDEPPAAVGKGSRRDRKWRPIVPVPASAPACDFYHWHYKNPEATWAYEFEGELYGYVARFRTSEGGKEVVPYTWCVDESDGRGTMRWHAMQFPEPRPLYVPATLLSGSPRDVPVVLVEGEKCALAGHMLLGGEFDFVSWPGGGNAWAKANWGWLLGRTVYLWPDCDAKRRKLSREERENNVDPTSKEMFPEAMQPGMKAMVNIGSLLVADQACTVLMCPVPKPGAVGDGWDIADAIASGWDAEAVRAFIRGARAFVPPDDAARAKARTTEGISTALKAGAGSGEGDEPVDPNERWRGSLITSAKGAILAVRENIVMALDGWPAKGIPGIAEAAGLIAFNEFTNNVEKTRATPWGTPAGIWLESDELQMGQWLVREHWLPSMSRATLEEAVLIVAQQHSFHPVRERMEALRGKWDGTHRLKTWVRRCCLEEDEYDHRDPLQRYLARVGKWFLMGMVARVLPTVKDGARVVRGPGTKFDTMLIFEGPQSWGKSSLAAVLGGEHFADTGLMIGDKDSYQNIQGVLVYEWGELENLTRQEVTKVKLFVSSPKDRFRASFDKRPRDYPRQVVFVGTTNESTYLTDLTGNRRFWPVRITRPPDLEWLRENLDQLISEALSCLDAGDRFWPTREEQRELFDPQQKARTIESSLESAIRLFLYDDEQVVPLGRRNGALINEIGMQELLDRIGYTIDKQTDVVVKKASALLHSLGWEVGKRGKKDEHGKRPRLYVRPKDPPDDAASASNSSTRPPQGDDTEGPADDCPF